MTLWFLKLSSTWTWKTKKIGLYGQWMSMVPCKIFKHHSINTSAFHSAVPVLEVAVEEVAVEEVAELVVLAVALVVLVVVLVTVDRVELVIDVIVTVTPDTPKPSEFFHANTKFNRSKLPLSVLRNLSNIREMTAECNGKLCKYYTKLIQTMIFNMQNYVNMSMKTIMIMTHF